MKTNSNMIEDPTRTEKLERAKKQVAEIKGFYIHLIIYIIINLLLLLVAMGVFSGDRFRFGMPSWGHFTTPFFWGIGLFFHGLKVFGSKSKILKDWEERKIKEYLEKEDETLNKFK
tara:strand:- start:687 stop:1034 length:348 start_codon:yes stop_codon:yes gene_type:complete